MSLDGLEREVVIGHNPVGIDPPKRHICLWRTA